MFYEDVFEIREIDPQGKKFDRVSRFVCQCDNDTTQITVDINAELFPLKLGQRVTIALATTLSLDPSDVKSDVFDPTLLDGYRSKPNLMDKYDYVMHGQEFRTQVNKDGTVEIYVSYGGLLMCAKGSPATLSFPSGKTDSEKKIYLLMKVNAE